MNIGVPWDFRVTLDLFLGGIGIAVFLLTVYLSSYAREKFWPLVKVGFYTAPLAVGTGLFFLISEIGKPERMYTTFFRTNPTSVTSWGGFFQAAFILLSLTLAYMVFKKGKDAFNGSLTRNLQIVGVIVALAVGVYHGLLLSSLGRPIWAGGLIPVLFLVSSLLAGTGYMLAVKSVLGVSISSEMNVSETAAASEGVNGSRNFIILLTGLSAIQMILLFIWQISSYRLGNDVLQTMESLFATYGLSWWGIVVVAGLLVPFLIGIYFVFTNRKQDVSVGLNVTIALLVILGSYTFKHILVAAGQIQIPFFLN